MEVLRRDTDTRHPLPHTLHHRRRSANVYVDVAVAKVVLRKVVGDVTKLWMPTCAIDRARKEVEIRHERFQLDQRVELDQVVISVYAVSQRDRLIGRVVVEPTQRA